MLGVVLRRRAERAGSRRRAAGRRHKLVFRPSSPAAAREEQPAPRPPDRAGPMRAGKRRRSGRRGFPGGGGDRAREQGWDAPSAPPGPAAALLNREARGRADLGRGLGRTSHPVSRPPELRGRRRSSSEPEAGRHLPPIPGLRAPPGRRRREERLDRGRAWSTPVMAAAASRLLQAWPRHRPQPGPTPRPRAAPALPLPASNQGPCSPPAPPGSPRVESGRGDPPPQRGERQRSPGRGSAGGRGGEGAGRRRGHGARGSPPRIGPRCTSTTCGAAAPTPLPTPPPPAPATRARKQNKLQVAAAGGGGRVTHPHPAQPARVVQPRGQGRPEDH